MKRKLLSVIALFLCVFSIAANAAPIWTYGGKETGLFWNKIYAYTTGYRAGADKIKVKIISDNNYPWKEKSSGTLFGVNTTVEDTRPNAKGTDYSIHAAYCLGSSDVATKSY